MINKPAKPLKHEGAKLSVLEISIARNAAEMGMQELVDIKTNTNRQFPKIQNKNWHIVLICILSFKMLIL